MRTNKSTVLNTSNIPLYLTPRTVKRMLNKHFLTDDHRNGTNLSLGYFPTYSLASNQPEDEKTENVLNASNP